MTRHELKKRLEELSQKDLEKFDRDLGGGPKTPDQRVREFVDDPTHERRICQLLDLQTEDEKLTEAALRSADAADQSARSARWSVIWSGIAGFVALIAAAVTIIGLFQEG